jgi:hypothetical protein
MDLNKLKNAVAKESPMAGFLAQTPTILEQPQEESVTPAPTDTILNKPKPTTRKQNRKQTKTPPSITTTTQLQVDTFDEKGELYERKTARVCFVLKESLSQRFTKYQRTNRIRSKNEAISQILEEYLSSKGY